MFGGDNLYCHFKTLADVGIKGDCQSVKLINQLSEPAKTKSEKPQA